MWTVFYLCPIHKDAEVSNFGRVQTLALYKAADWMGMPSYA